MTYSLPKLTAVDSPLPATKPVDGEAAEIARSQFRGRLKSGDFSYWRSSTPALALAALIVVTLVATAFGQQLLSPTAAGSHLFAGAGQGGGSPTADGQQLVAEAARRLLAESSMKANVRFRVNAFDHEVTGVGSYVQLGQGPEKLLRLELKSQVGDQTATVQEICSEDEYWVRRDVPQLGATVGRASLRPIRQAITKAAKDPNVDPIQSWILLGGLPRLMEELHRSFQFGPAEASELEFASADGAGTERMPVWIVTGAWKPERLAGLLQGKPAKDAPELPAQLPTHVELVLGRVDQAFPLFPYRITYLRAAEQGGDADKTIQSPAAMSPFVTLELYGVYHTTEIDPRAFHYDPGDQEVADLTQTFLQRLGLLGK